MAGLASGHVDQTEGIVAALYREAEDATTVSAASRAVGPVASRMPSHAASDSAITGTGVSLEGFCHLITHCTLFDTSFDHTHASQLFKQIANEKLNDSAPASILDAKGNVMLTRQGFKMMLEHVGRQRSQAKSSQRGSVGGSLGVARAQAAALQELIREIHLRRDGTLEVEMSDVHGPMYAEDVIAAVYAYGHPLKQLFQHYQTSEGGAKVMSCRSVYRCCRATGLVPDYLVPAEFGDLVTLFGAGAAKRGAGATSSERAERAAERRYLESNTCMSGGENQDWTAPAPGGMLAGEPCYEVVGFIEFMAAAALHAPPRPHAESPQVRAQRIHEVFGQVMGLPLGVTLGNQEELDAKAFLVDRLKLSRRLSSPERGRIPAGAPPPTNLGQVIMELDWELPPLHSKVDPRVAQPPPPPPPPVLLLAKDEKDKAAEQLPASPTKSGASAASGEKAPATPKDALGANAPPQRKPLPLQPPTTDELIERAEKKREAERKAASAAKKAAAKGKRFVAKPKAKSKTIDDLEKKRPKGPIEFNKVQFYAKRPERPPPDKLPEVLREQRRSHQLHLNDLRLSQKREEAAGASMGPGGWVLRMALIDEPLRAPQCAKSEEVSTLMETALASRRLRQYTEAIDLLIAARQKWAALEAGREAAHQWSGVQEMNPVPSPWGRPAWAVSAEANQVTYGLRPGTAPKSSKAFTARAFHQPDQAAEHCAVSSTAPAAAAPEEPPHERTSSAMGHRGGASTPRARLAPNPPPGAPSGSQTARRYKPQVNFALALGDQDPHLTKLPPEAGLFFYCELASLHAAVGGDDLAAQLLWRARTQSDRLPNGHPDSAVVWCAFGRLAFLSGSFEVAARATMRGRWIREKALGGDTIETATTYNNLACCLSAVGRSLEAEAYLDLATEILKVLAGEDHPRCQTAMRNLEKARSAKRQLSLEIPHIFSFPVKAIYAQSKGKTKKKGKSRGSSKSSNGSKSSKGSRRKKK